MNNKAREFENIEKLITVARSQAESMRATLADIETACASAGTSLEWLDQSVRQQEARSKSLGPEGPEALAQFLEAARLRRGNIEASIRQLRALADNACAAVQESDAEVTKLERLSLRRRGTPGKQNCEPDQGAYAPGERASPR